MNAPIPKLFQRPETREAALLALRNVEQFRELTVDRGKMDEDKRTVEVAFASETAYERYWGVEILSVVAKSMRMDRLKDGAPLLVQHDPADQIGVVESVRLGSDKVARATVRFSKSARGEEIFRDVLDGIRSKISVGYVIHDMVLEAKKKDVPTYRVTDWEPLEVSLVSIPADNTVGVGRADDRSSHTKEHHAMTDTTTVSSETAEGQASEHLEQVRAMGVQAEKDVISRINEVKSIAKQFEHIYPESARLAEDFTRKAGFTPDSFRKVLLEAIRQQRAPLTDIGQPGPDDYQQAGSTRATYGMSAREMLQGASVRAFKGTGKMLGGRMTDQEAAYRAGQWCKAVIHGDANALRWCIDAGVQMSKGSGENVSRAMTEGIFTSAGWLIPTEMEASIIANREQYGVARRICQVVPMSTASTQIPRITADQTAYFVGEGTAGTESDSAGDQVGLTLKDLMAYSRIGKSTAQDSAIPLAELIANEQSRAFAIKEDACLFIGDGTSTYGGIMGINTLLELAAYAGGRYTNVTPINTFGEVTNTEISGLLGKLPVYARQGARWVCSGMAEALMFSRLRMAAGGNDTGTLNGGVLEFPYAGFPVTVAHHMPAGATTDYNAKIMVLLGNFQLGVALGSGAGMMMTVDPYSQAEQNLTRIITSERIDIVSHGVNKSTTVPGPIVGMYGTT